MQIDALLSLILEVTRLFVFSVQLHSAYYVYSGDEAVSSNVKSMRQGFIGNDSIYFCNLSPDIY